MVNWQNDYKKKLISPDYAASLVKSGDKVKMAHRRAVSNFMLALVKRASELRDVELSSNWFYDYPFLRPGLEESFRVKTGYATRVIRDIGLKYIDWIAFVTGLSGDVERQANQDRASGYNYGDFFIAFITPPDKDGICSYGPDVWWSPNGTATAKTVIAEVDHSLPWVYGDSIHVSNIDYFIDAPAEKEKIYYSPTPPSDEYEKLQVIGALAAELVNDGDTIQVGTGSASEGVYDFLGAMNYLGIHSEIIDAGAMNLVKQGVINGKNKNFHHGKAVGGGSTITHYEQYRPLLDFIDHNPMFEFKDSSWVSSIQNVMANDNMVAINTALSIDLLGQVNCSSLGSEFISGPGGQIEFCFGAHCSKGGRSVHCLLSTAVKGTKSRIVPMFEPGTHVSVPIPFIDYLVTEYGVVNLENKSARERSEAIISVAHPDFQPELRKAAKKLFWP